MSYAQLGHSCQTSMAVLIDNRKFFPPIYDAFFTKMQKYPSTTEHEPRISPDIEKPEDIKIAKLIPKASEEFCCGKK